MKFTKKTMIVVIVLLLIPAVPFRSKIFGSGYTPAITDESGTVPPESISSLEKEFIVVHWDQRGAGKSNPPDFDESTMSYEQFISDTHQLTEYLKDRFGKEKIFILGHSWGTQPGLEAVGRYPGDYYGYIGVSQVVSHELSDTIARDWLVDHIRKKDRKKDLEKLESLGPPPYTDHDDFVTFIRLVDAYGGSFDLPFSSLVLISLRSPEYTFGDMFAWLRGANRGSGQMWSEKVYSTFDAMIKFPELKVPVYFFQGRHDYNTPLAATGKYFENLKDPAGKRLIVFEDSAHTPFLAEPEKFVRELYKVKEETYP